MFCVTLGKLIINLRVSASFLLCKWSPSTCHIGLHINSLAQCMAHSKCLVHIGYGWFWRSVYIWMHIFFNLRNVDIIFIHSTFCYWSLQASCIISNTQHFIFITETGKQAGKFFQILIKLFKNISSQPTLNVLILEQYLPKMYSIFKQH